jgi:hypothetical protein
VVWAFEWEYFVFVTQLEQNVMAWLFINTSPHAQTAPPASHGASHLLYVQTIEICPVEESTKTTTTTHTLTYIVVFHFGTHWPFFFVLFCAVFSFALSRYALRYKVEREKNTCASPCTQFV